MKCFMFLDKYKPCFNHLLDLYVGHYIMTILHMVRLFTSCYTISIASRLSHAKREGTKLAPVIILLGNSKQRERA